MTIQELVTAVEQQLPVKVAIINNRYLGMVRQWQELLYDNHISGSDLHTAPDWVRLAEAMGALGLRATKVSEVEPVLEQALAHPGPVLIDFRVREDENCYPMVPAGSPSAKMLLRDPGSE
jgi:acetolactate synthase-1/2/3 large subunit